MRPALSQCPGGRLPVVRIAPAACLLAVLAALSISCDRSARAPADGGLQSRSLGASGMQAARATGFAGEADRGGFIVVCPDGQPIPATSGDGRGWIITPEPHADLDFLSRLLDTLQAEYTIDAARIFVAG